MLHLGPVDGPGALTKLGDGTLFISGGYSFLGSVFVEGGSLVLNNEDGSFVVLAGHRLFMSGAGLTVAAVPEPQTWALMFAGFSAVVVYAKRRRGKAAS